MKTSKRNRREYELVFGAGPLGLTLQPEYNPQGDFPLVTVKRCIPSFQAETFGAITEGDLVVAVQDRNVESFLEYSELIKFLRDAKRPIRIRFSSTSMSTPAERVRESLQARIDALEHALNRDEIQLDELKEFARAGLPDKHRALVWKLLLGNLPLKRSEWASHTAKQGELYETYTRDMFAAHARKDDGTRPVRMEGQAWYEQTAEDEEAIKAAAKARRKKQMELDAEDKDEFEPVDDVLDDDIWKDVQRTHPGYHFFTQPTYVRMHRILYIYGRLNSGVSYVQGMNEILAPIVYVFGAYPGSDEANFEPDSFFCFAALMSDVRDMFIRSLDGEKSGLHGQIQRLEEMVTRHDAKLAMHLKSLDLHFQFFAVRWLTTLLTREFDLPDALRLWDSMLGSSRRFNFILCCCTAMILARRNFLMDNDFPTCLKMLQAPCVTPVETIIRDAERINKAEMNMSGRISFVKRAPFMLSAPKLNNVEAVASDFFRAAAKVAKAVVEEAKSVVDDFKQQQQQNSGSSGEEGQQFVRQQQSQVRSSNNESPLNSPAATMSNSASTSSLVGGGEGFIVRKQMSTGQQNHHQNSRFSSSGELDKTDDGL